MSARVNVLTVMEMHAPSGSQSMMESGRLLASNDDGDCTFAFLFFSVESMKILCLMFDWKLELLLKCWSLGAALEHRGNLLALESSGWQVRSNNCHDQ